MKRFEGLCFFIPLFDFSFVLESCFSWFIRSITLSFAELMVKLVELCGSSVTLKCPLPNGDLETLISITSDEDLKNIIEEYNRASSSLTHPLKIRAILSPPKKLSPPPSSSASSTHSPSGSVYASVESPPYAVENRLNRLNCSQVPLGIRNWGVKGSCYTRQLDGSPRFLYRFANNYCHWGKVMLEIFVSSKELVLCVREVRDCSFHLQPYQKSM